MYEQDRSFVDWVLGCDHYAHSGYQVDIVQHDASNMYHGHYSRDHYDSECSSVENDEAIAVALQEEFSQIAIAESSESPQAANEQLQLPVHENDCQSSPTTNYNPGRLFSFFFCMTTVSLRLDLKFNHLCLCSRL